MNVRELIGSLLDYTADTEVELQNVNAEDGIGGYAITQVDSEDDTSVKLYYEGPQPGEEDEAV